MSLSPPVPHGFVRQYADLATTIASLAPSCGPVRLVAIDGPGGAGKSTFADRLAAPLGVPPVVHTDDFATWETPLDWFSRLQAQVVDPLAAGRPGRYQRYDWVRRELAEWHDVPVAPVVILEGVGSARKAIADRLVFAVWIETPADLRLARGIERDGEDSRDFWTSWIKGEIAHYVEDRTRDRADLIVDGAPALPHDPATEYIAAAEPRAPQTHRPTDSDDHAQTW
jgi:uridine kinase